MGIFNIDFIIQKISEANPATSAAWATLPVAIFLTIKIVRKSLKYLHDYEYSYMFALKD